ncbi:tyrosine kinase protein [Ceratocystis lukuohia]
MLIYWAGTQDAVHLVDMNEHQSIAYISDIGALTLKPLFIAGCAVTSVFFAVSFIATRWLRHRGRLLPNVTMFQRTLMYLNIFSVIVGTAGLIFLSIFDAYRHSGVHNACLVLFLLGFIASAIFACWEFRSLRHYYVDEPHLEASFYTKLAFIIFEGSLAIVFGILVKTHHRDAAAVVEWILAFIFSFYVFSYVMDLWPAVHTKKPEMRYHKPQRLAVGSSGGSPHTLEQAIVPPPPPPPEAHMGHF